MASKLFKGFRQIDGSNTGFTTDDFENGYIYFVRTDDEGEQGYIYFNGKMYGNDEECIDCGTY